MGPRLPGVNCALLSLLRVVQWTLANWAVLKRNTMYSELASTVICQAIGGLTI